ncbi:ABC transporter permease [Salarchaeum sp. JOR-1]|uniref:ABC transporter permease n=1 Tax=Salarchaeum sp. JOR-1 TaxID=2599399 RepID=UPI0011984D1C|nr:ABC transporter permease subunit [Salarchaeum sp. JOR-1]QDX40181.1 ABC transporter permease subunit [Salarchaeum sp. JOR-1]
MSLRTVARDDLKNAARSYVVLGVVGVFAALVALVFVAERNIYPDPYRTLFDVSFMTFLVFPLFVAPLSYLAVAGDRESGVIKYALGLPNSRLSYVLGKFASRVSVTLGAVVVALLAGFAVAFATFKSAPSLGRFATFAGVSALYGVSLTGLFVGVSAATSRRSRAMLGVFGAYFLLVPFWFGFLPIVNLGTVLDAVATALGTTITDSTRSFVNALSPATAYLVATEPVYSGVVDQYPRIAGNFGGESTAIQDKLWFNVFVMAAWGVLGLLAGYASFRRSELG